MDVDSASAGAAVGEGQVRAADAGSGAGPDFGPDVGSGGTCRACGVELDSHATVIRLSDEGTERDCAWVIELLDIEDEVVVPMLGMVGLGRQDVSRERLREMALAVWRWHHLP